MSTASKLRQRLEAQAQKRLESTKAAAAGDDDAENADPQCVPRSVGAPRSMKQLLEQRSGAAPGEAAAGDTSLASLPSEASFSGSVDTRTIGDDMEMTECVGGGIVSAPPPSTPAFANGQTPSVGARRRVNVGVDGETPLQLREVVMTPNTERKQRTWQPNKYEAALSALEEKAEEEVDSGRSRTSSSESESSPRDGEGEDDLPAIPAPKASSRFRHRDSLMISHRAREQLQAETCECAAEVDELSPQTVTTEIGSQSPAKSRRVKELEGKLRIETERRKTAESKVATLEAKLATQKGQEEDRERSSARVRRLESQIEEMGAELARLGTHPTPLFGGLSTFGSGSRCGCVRADSIAAKGDFNAKDTKVLHMKENPTAKAMHLKLVDEVREQLRSEGGAGSVNNQSAPANQELVDDLKKKLAATEKRMERLKEVFQKNASDFREACFYLLGWEISLEQVDTKDAAGGMRYKLRSMYANSETEYLVFKRRAGGEGGDLDMEPTDYAQTLEKEIEVLLRQFRSIPAFLSHVTTDVWDSKTKFT